MLLICSLLDYYRKSVLLTVAWAIYTNGWRLECQLWPDRSEVSLLLEITCFTFILLFEKTLFNLLLEYLMLAG